MEFDIVDWRHHCDCRWSSTLLTVGAIVRAVDRWSSTLLIGGTSTTQVMETGKPPWTNATGFDRTVETGAQAAQEADRAQAAPA